MKHWLLFANAPLALLVSILISALCGLPSYAIASSTHEMPNNDSTKLSGSLRTLWGENMPGITIHVSGKYPSEDPFSFSVTTDKDGKFSFDLPTGSSYRVYPMFPDTGYANGVNTADLILIGRHTNGIVPLDPPYGLIAADVNASRSVTASDMTGVKDLILGIHPKLPAGSPWRAIAESFVFPDVTNPFRTIFSESIEGVVKSADNEPLDFIAVKVGDVNYTARLDPLSVPPKKLWYWEIQDRGVFKGQILELTLVGEGIVSGIQGTLEFTDMEVIAVLPSSHFPSPLGHISKDGRRLTFLGVDNLPEEKGFKPRLNIRVRALRNGYLRNFIALTHDPTPAEAYRFSDLEAFEARLRFNKMFVAAESLTLRNASEEEEYSHALFQASGLALRSQPNPFDQWTQVYVHLPKEAQTTLRVHDATGRLLWERSLYLPEGTHVVRLDAAALSNTKGVLQFSVETSHDRAVHRLLRF